MPPFAPRKFKTPQQRTAERAAEKKAVKDYMQNRDEMNMFWCKYFLERRREYSESSIQLQYAYRVAERLKFIFEEDIAE